MSNISAASTVSGVNVISSVSCINKVRTSINQRLGICVRRFLMLFNWYLLFFRLTTYYRHGHNTQYL